MYDVQETRGRASSLDWPSFTPCSFGNTIGTPTNWLSSILIGTTNSCIKTPGRYSVPYFNTSPSTSSYPEFLGGMPYVSTNSTSSPKDTMQVIIAKSPRLLASREIFHHSSLIRLFSCVQFWKQFNDSTPVRCNKPNHDVLEIESFIDSTINWQA